MKTFFTIMLAAVLAFSWSWNASAIHLRGLGAGCAGVSGGPVILRLQTARAARVARRHERRAAGFGAGCAGVEAPVGCAGVAAPVGCAGAVTFVPSVLVPAGACGTACACGCATGAPCTCAK